MSGDDGTVGKLIPITPDTGVPTEVDITSIEGAVPWLESLKKYVQDHLIVQTGALNLSKNYGELFFGKVDSAPQVYAKHNAYVKAVIESYRDIARSLDVAMDATAAIAKNYKDAEHNNKLNVAAVDKAFADQSGGSGTPGTVPTSSSGNGSTQGSF